MVPEDLGGGSVSGNGVRDLALVADAFGRHAAPGPLLACNVVALGLSRSGSPEQQGEILPAIVSGDVVATWTFTETPPNDGLGELAELRAEADGGDFVLTGVKGLVEAGAEADQILVTATTDAGPAQFLVAAQTPGLTVTPLRSVDLVRRFARIEFDGVRLPASAAVGEPGSAADDVEQQLRLAGVVQAAEMVGAADTIFDITLDWAFSRYSFGRPLASYQEIKHRFADMKMWLEARPLPAAHQLGRAQAPRPQRVRRQDPRGRASSCAASR